MSGTYARIRALLAQAGFDVEGRRDVMEAIWRLLDERAPVGSDEYDI